MTDVRSIKATVFEVREEGVLLNCRLPHDEVSIKVPFAMVPERLRIYGMPVSVAMKDDNSIVIEERVPDPIVMTEEEQAALKEIDDWLKAND